MRPTKIGSEPFQEEIHYLFAYRGWGGVELDMFFLLNHSSLCGLPVGNVLVYNESVV